MDAIVMSSKRTLEARNAPMVAGSADRGSGFDLNKRTGQPVCHWSDIQGRGMFEKSFVTTIQPMLETAYDAFIR